MKKKLFMVLVCAAMAVSTVGCSFNVNDIINGGNQNDEDEDDNDDDDDDDNGNGVQNSDAKEMYDAFLKGNERLFADSEKFSYYDIDLDENVCKFDKPDGYLIEEFLNQVVTDVNRDIYCNMESASYTFIDLGKDGEPELLVSTVFYTEYENINRDYVIKCVDGKLVLCKEMEGLGYKTEALSNEYGLITGTQNYDIYNSYTDYGYLDADGEYNFWYTRQSNYEGYIFLDSRFSEWTYNRDSYELYIDIYQFEEAQIDELYYNYYCYCAEIPADAPTNGLDRDGNLAEAQALFDKAGVKLYSRDEINELMAKKQKEIGLSDEIANAEKSYDEYDWKNLSYDYDTVNGITEVYVTNVDELMAAIKDKATITLAPGTYNVTDWLVRKINSGEVRYLYDYDSGYYAFANPDEHIFYYGSDDEPALVLRNLIGLTIRSESPAYPATIVSEPIFYDVLDFVNDYYIELENLVVGHVEQPGSTCAGDVICMSDCNDVVISGCDLYGCGAIGLVLRSAYDVELRDTVIHDCSSGAISMSYADIMVYDCIFRDIDGWVLFGMTNSYASYSDCIFRDIYGYYLVDGGDYNYLYYKGCYFDEDMADYLAAMQEDGYDWIIIE